MKYDHAISLALRCAAAGTLIGGTIFFVGGIADPPSTGVGHSFLLLSIALSALSIAHQPKEPK